MYSEHKLAVRGAQPLIDRVYAFAKEAHGDQKRKYTLEPYIAHPVAVARIVQQYDGSIDMLCAALLHDTVEDTAITFMDIETEFGWGIMNLVRQLTDVSKKSDGNRSIRKAIDCQYLAGASPDAQTIKLADLIHNTGSIVDNDKQFAEIYLMEKSNLLAVLLKGDKRLHKLAMEVTNRATTKLGL